ncbi:MAG: hypothetical protein U0X73_08080 [Thermoanaerobaculia bacterium]
MRCTRSAPIAGTLAGETSAVLAGEDTWTAPVELWASAGEAPSVTNNHGRATAAAGRAQREREIEITMGSAGEM